MGTRASFTYLLKTSSLDFLLSLGSTKAITGSLQLIISFLFPYLSFMEPTLKSYFFFLVFNFKNKVILPAFYNWIILAIPSERFYFPETKVFNLPVAQFNFL